MKLKISDHAKEQMVDREISIDWVLKVAKNPEQKYNIDIDETVCQSKVDIGKRLIC